MSKMALVAAAGRGAKKGASVLQLLFWLLFVASITMNVAFLSGCEARGGWVDKLKLMHPQHPNASGETPHPPVPTATAQVENEAYFLRELAEKLGIQDIAGKTPGDIAYDVGQQFDGLDRQLKVGGRKLAAAEEQLKVKSRQLADCEGQLKEKARQLEDSGRQLAACKERLAGQERQLAGGFVYDGPVFSDADYADTEEVLLSQQDKQTFAAYHALAKKLAGKKVIVVAE